MPVAVGSGGPALLVDAAGLAYDAENPLPVSGAPGGEATIADGADVAQGATDDVAVTNPAAEAATVCALLRGILSILVDIKAILTDVHDVENNSISTTETPA